MRFADRWFGKKEPRPTQPSKSGKSLYCHRCGVPLERGFLETPWIDVRSDNYLSAMAEYEENMARDENTEIEGVLRIEVVPRRPEGPKQVYCHYCSHCEGVVVVSSHRQKVYARKLYVARL